MLPHRGKDCFRAFDWKLKTQSNSPRVWRDCGFGIEMDATRAHGCMQKTRLRFVVQGNEQPKRWHRAYEQEKATNTWQQKVLWFLGLWKRTREKFGKITERPLTREPGSKGEHTCSSLSPEARQLQWNRYHLHTVFFMMTYKWCIKTRSHTHTHTHTHTQKRSRAPVISNGTWTRQPSSWAVCGFLFFCAMLFHTLHVHGV